MPEKRVHILKMLAFMTENGSEGLQLRSNYTLFIRVKHRLLKQLRNFLKQLLQGSVME